MTCRCECRDPWAYAPSWAIELKHMLEHLKGKIMDEFDELKATQAAIADKVAKVKVDVEALQAQIAAIPLPGMTDEQKSALADVTASAKSILVSLSAVDDMTPDKAPEPAPEPTPEPTPTPEPGV